jgi:hypothetical protein
MPYLRLYLPEISIAQKRHVAQKLIDLTLRASRRRRHWDREQITIQFLPQSQSRQRGECRVEVLGHNLTSVDQRAFTEEVGPMLIRSLHLNVKNRLAWLMGIETKLSPRVDVHFHELPFDAVVAGECTVGDAFVSEWKKAA